MSIVRGPANRQLSSLLRRRLSPKTRVVQPLLFNRLLLHFNIVKKYLITLRNTPSTPPDNYTTIFGIR